VARPNPAVMPTRCGTRTVVSLRRWAATSRRNSCSPSFADTRSDSEAVFARGAPEHSNLIIVAGPCLQVVKGHNAKSHHCCHGAGGRQRHVCAVHRLPNCSIVTSKTLPKPRTGPVAIQYGLQRFPLRLDGLENR
jgi:hypothetical protein